MDDIKVGQILTSSAPTTPKPITIGENTAADIMLQTRYAIIYKCKIILQNHNAIGVICFWLKSHTNNVLYIHTYQLQMLIKTTKTRYEGMCN